MGFKMLIPQKDTCTSCMQNCSLFKALPFGATYTLWFLTILRDSTKGERLQPSLNTFTVQNQCLPRTPKCRDGVWLWDPHWQHLKELATLTWVTWDCSVALESLSGVLHPLKLISSIPSNDKSSMIPSTSLGTPDACSQKTLHSVTSMVAIDLATMSDSSIATCKAVQPCILWDLG